MALNSRNPVFFRQIGRLSRHAGLVAVVFGVVLLCFIWGGLYYKIQAERELETANAFKETANLARVFEEHTLRTIKGVDQTMLFIKHEYEQHGPAIDIPRYLKEGRIASQPLVLLGVIDENGDLTVSSQVPFVPSNLSDREHFLVHKDSDSGELFIGKPVLGRSSGKWSIQLTRRVNKPDGSFGGVVAAAVDPDYFTSFYRQVDLGDNSAVALVGRDGVIRARKYGRAADAANVVVKSPLTEGLRSKDAGSYRSVSTVDGVKRLYSYRAVRGYPVAVLVGLDEREVFRELDVRVAGYYWVAGAVTLVVAFFIVIMLNISSRQRRTEKELRQARDELESKVKERTRELSAANQSLTALNEKHLAMNEELLHSNAVLQREIGERKRVESVLQAAKEELSRKNGELTEALNMIEQTQKEMIRQEKLAGIGQLAAGVAHEINNPLSFVTGNVETLEKYFAAFRAILVRYRELRARMPHDAAPAELKKADQGLDFMLDDLPELFRDTAEGLNRIGRIVRGMRVFSHVDRRPAFARYDLHEGLESALLMAHNEIKHSAAVDKRFGAVPEIEAVGGEINQVLLNLIVNAAQAVKAKGGMGTIRIATWADGEEAFCSVEDDGVGISPEHIGNIFNPFFTTKPVGQGTGLGLSISYDIVVNHHGGDIMVESTAGRGSKFTVRLPIRRRPDGQE
jgi:signal transduction histidine kinase